MVIIIADRTTAMPHLQQYPCLQHKKIKTIMEQKVKCSQSKLKIASLNKKECCLTATQQFFSYIMARTS
jgi:hypothetical protein